MAEREERNVIESDVGLNVGPACGTFLIRANNQNYHNIFPEVVHVRSHGSIRDMNLENSRALQKLTADDVLPMQFGYYEAGELFYHKYASAVGFIVRKDCIGKNKQGKVVMRRWVCNTSTRIHCPAAFSISVGRVCQEWFVREFVAEHTHELTPTCKSHLQIDPPVMKSENSKKKGLNYNCSRAENPEITIFDVEIALDYLSDKMDKDKGFFYETKFVEGRLTSLFWADSTSQLNNACFGEVMAVYRTNSYMMPFVILAGLNHHHQTCVFGCALLHEETIEAYTWLFQTFLHVMQGCMPLSIVTEDHKAIRKAIKHVLPRSRHRLCTWDLKNKAHSIVNKRSFVSDFKVCMLEVLTLENFELKWKAMVEKYKLSENPWIQRMYKKRHMWAETYLRGHFWGGLQSTRRVCERINQRLSMFSQHKLRLHQFINLYDKTVDYAVVYSEVNGEYESANAEFSPKTRLVKIEKHAADVYTLESYKRFLSEMRLETLLFVLNKHDGSNHSTYKLGNYENQNLVYEVMFKPSGPSIKCSCFKFETLGFPCSHIIHVIKSERLEKIPQNLIHLRWTKTAKSTAQFWQRALPPVPSDIMTKLMRTGNLMYYCSMLCYLGSQSEQEYNHVRSSVLMLYLEHKERSFARHAIASNSETLNSEKDKGSVSRIGRSKGSQPDDDNGEKRRKTNGEGHSRNVEVEEQIKNGCLKLISADISVADIQVMQDKGRDLVANPHLSR